MNHDRAAADAAALFSVRPKANLHKGKRPKGDKIFGLGRKEMRFSLYFITLE